MKILNIADSSKGAAGQQKRDQQRLLDLQTQIVAKTRELQEIEVLFNETLKRHGEQWKLETSLHEETIKELKAEIEKLQTERLQALIPLVNKQEEWENIVSALKFREESAATREHEAEQLTEQLTSRLDEVSEREINATEYLKRLENREKGIALQEKQIKDSSDKLTLFIRQENGRLEKENANLERRKADVKLKEKSLKGREDALRERELDVQTKEVLYRNYPFPTPISHGPQ